MLLISSKKFFSFSVYSDLFFHLFSLFYLSAIAREDDQKLKNAEFDILRRKEGLILKLDQLIEYQITKIFTEKLSRKFASKASPRPLFKFGKLSKETNAYK